MKTKFNKIVLLCALSAFSLSSCESFLDMPEIEQVTFDKIWEKRTFTERALWEVYTYIPNGSSQTDNVTIGAADESSCSWSTSNYAFSLLNKGSWSVSNPAGQKMTHYYRGIREANVFMQNVDRCTAFDVTEEEKAAWKVEARFLRAFFYGEMIRTHGPVVLLKDKILAADAPVSEYQLPRNTIDECVDWVCSEMEEVAKSLPVQYADASHWGKPTSVAALCYVARMRMIAARDLFNGNPLFKGVQNQDGTRLFPDCDANKWVVAATASKAAIKAIEDSGKYGIYKHSSGNVYQTLHGLWYDKWNSEMIWSRYIGVGTWGNHTRPRVFGGYGGHGPTQQQVDAYAMANGIYPIVGYEGDTYHLNQRTKAGVNGITGKPVGGTPTIDPKSMYSENNFAAFNRPDPALGEWESNAQTWGMYRNREPRFYNHLSWNDTYYFQKHNLKVGTKVQYHDGGNTGPQHHDHPWTGYMARKFGNATLNASAINWGWFNWPMIRVAEVYLNYCETLVESDINNPDLLKYLNLIRDRAGVPLIGTTPTEVYGEKIGNQVEMRELVRRERRVELAFEGHRYFDTREWLIAETTDNGPMWGMNLRAQSSAKVLGETSFWKRTVIQNRVFKKQHYLYPYRQYELDRNKQIVQNYGW